ncbi:MAG: P1 family peptidase [Desulfovibrio sp.]|nr:P1 family peptidase [Desulfovibrio sp.]
MDVIDLRFVDGFLVGHAEDREAGTGCTAVLTPAGASASVYTPGFAPGSRETALLRPESSPQEIHGLLLAGGSAFGLSAASGIVRFLREQGVGLDTGAIRVPLVPGAVIYDYPGNKSQGLLPDEDMGYRAARAAGGKACMRGPHGAGVSARSGKIGGHERSSPSGIGSAGMTDDGLQLAALAVVNPLGSVVDPADGRIVSGLRRPDGSLASHGEILAAVKDAAGRMGDGAPGHTVLVVVGTNARLDKLGAFRVSRMAAAGIARAIFPAHLLFDGDTLFTLASNTGPVVDVNVLGAYAAQITAQAVLDAACSAGA